MMNTIHFEVLHGGRGSMKKMNNFLRKHEFGNLVLNEIRGYLIEDESGKCHFELAGGNLDETAENDCQRYTYQLDYVVTTRTEEHVEETLTAEWRLTHPEYVFCSLSRCRFEHWDAFVIVYRVHTKR